MIKLRFCCCNIKNSWGNALGMLPGRGQRAGLKKSSKNVEVALRLRLWIQPLVANPIEGKTMAAHINVVGWYDSESEGEKDNYIGLRKRNSEVASKANVWQQPKERGSDQAVTREGSLTTNSSCSSITKKQRSLSTLGRRFSAVLRINLPCIEKQ